MVRGVNSTALRESNCDPSGQLPWQVCVVSFTTMWAALWELDLQGAMRTHKVVDGILQSNVTLQETLLKTQDLTLPIESYRMDSRRQPIPPAETKGGAGYDVRSTRRPQ